MILKTLPALLVLGALTVAPAAAQDGTDAAPAPPAPAAETTTGPKVALKVQPKKGDAFRYRSSFRTVMSMGGMEMNDISMETVLRVDVADVAEDGKLTLTLTHEHVKGEFKNPMVGDISFDSAKEVESDNPMAADIAGAFSLFTKGPIGLLVAPSGEVLTLTGSQELFDEHLSSSSMAAMLAGQYQNDVQKQQFQGSFVRFAPEALPVGGTWKIESTQSMGAMALTTVIDSTLKAADGDEVTVDSTAKAGDESMGMDMTTTSSAKVSATDGMVISSETSTKAIVAAQGVEQTIEAKMTRIGLDEVVVPPKAEEPAEAPDAPEAPVPGPGESGDDG